MSCPDKTAGTNNKKIILPEDRKMKSSNKSRFSAIVLSSLLIPAALFSCSNKNTSQSGSAPKEIDTESWGEVLTTGKIGSIVVNADLSQQVNENDTLFTLNSVIDAGLNNEDMRYIFFDVNIHNDMDVDCDLNTLNNFYLIMPDGSEMYSTVKAQLYAISKFKEDKYIVDPFEIPAKGEVSGVMGGFLIDKDVDHFTVCFFPTKNDPNNKELVVKIDVTADDFKTPDADILK